MGNLAEPLNVQPFTLSANEYSEKRASLPSDYLMRKGSERNLQTPRRFGRRAYSELTIRSGSHPGATARDVHRLIDLVRTRVQERFNVELELELSEW